MKKLIVGLGIAVTLVAGMVATEPEEQLIKIQTSDDQEFEIARYLANQMAPVRTFLEDVGDIAQVIPLPKVTALVFATIIKLLKNDPHDHVDLTTLSVDQLIDLANVCEYLTLKNVQIVVFKELNGRALPASLLKNMYDTVFKKFWRQHLAYGYILNSSALFKTLDIKPFPGAKLPLSELTTSTIQNTYGVIISPDGQKLITRSFHYGIIKIWDVNNLDQQPRDVQCDKVNQVIISPDGSKLISLSRMVDIKIWDMNNLNQAPYKLEREDELVSSVILSPDGSKLIISDFDQRVINIWHMNNLDQPSQRVEYPQVDHVIASLDGSKLIAWNFNPGEIIIWNMNNLKQDPDVHIFHVSKFIVSPDGSMVVSWSYKEGIIKIWDINNLDQAQYELRPKNVKYCIMSPDGSKLISWFVREGMIKTWDMNYPEQKPFELRHPILQSVSVNFNGSRLMSWSLDWYGVVAIKIWNFVTNNELDNLNPDQIKLMMWIYDHRDVTWFQSLSGLGLGISPTLKAAYQSLSDNLKNILRQSFPVVKLLERPSAQELLSRIRWWTPQS